jgi:hypothetical protein
MLSPVDTFRAWRGAAERLACDVVTKVEPRPGGQASASLRLAAVIGLARACARIGRESVSDDLSMPHRAFRRLDPAPFFTKISERGNVLQNGSGMGGRPSLDLPIRASIAGVNPACLRPVNRSRKQRWMGLLA